MARVSPRGPSGHGELAPDGHHLAATEGLTKVQSYLDIWPSPGSARAVPRGDRVRISPPSPEWDRHTLLSAMRDAIAALDLPEEEARARTADALAACVLRALSAPD